MRPQSILKTAQEIGVDPKVIRNMIAKGYVALIEVTPTQKWIDADQAVKMYPKYRDDMHKNIYRSKYY